MVEISDPVVFALQGPGLESVHAFKYFLLYINYVLQPLLSIRNLFFLTIYSCIAIYCLLLAEYSRVQLYSVVGFPYYSTNIDLLSLLKLIKVLNLSFTIPLIY
jgi:hypothetical protein